MLEDPSTLHTHREQNRAMPLSTSAGGYITNINVHPTYTNYLPNTRYGIPTDNTTPLSLSRPATTPSYDIGGDPYAVRNFTPETREMNVDNLGLAPDMNSAYAGQASLAKDPIHIDPGIYLPPAGQDGVEYSRNTTCTILEQSRASTSDAVTSSDEDHDAARTIKKRRATEKKSRNKLTLAYAEIKAILEEKGLSVKGRAEMLHAMASLYRNLNP